MKLDNFLNEYSSKLNALQKSFIVDVFFNDYGEKGLDLIVPEVRMDKGDGSGGYYDIDFVVTTKFRKYAIETHGYNYHAPGRVDRERFDYLTLKNNFINENFDKYIELTREQVMTKPDEAKYLLRQRFKADQELFNLYLNRGHKKISPSIPQQNALKAISKARENNINSGIIAMATGLGKTYLSALDILKFKPKRVLFVAHVLEILRKSKNDFEDLMKNKFNDIGVYDSGETNKPIQFATIQSIHKKKNLEKFDPEYFDYIVIDEAHHAAAATYVKVLEYFKPKFLLGLTATPFRNDKKDIMKLFGNNYFFEMYQEQAIREGWLANIVYKGFFDNVDYSNIRWNGSKYDIDDLNKLLMIEKRDHAIIEKYQELSSDHKTIGFCVSIDHAEYMSKKFNEAGIKSIAIHSKTESSESFFSIKDRDELLNDFRQGKYQIAFTVNMFNEGVDFPDVETILMLRPTDSLTIFIQQIGRGLRISHKKDHLQVLDFIGNYRTSPIILEGMKLSTTDFEFDAEKQLYLYDNNGFRVEFEEEVVEVFKSISAKYNREVDESKISEYWSDYAQFLETSTRTDKEKNNSVNHFWIIDKKKRDLDLHFWAINYIQENKNIYKTREEMNKNIRLASQEKNSPFEGTRALLFSQLLGFYERENWDKTSEVFDYLNKNPNKKDEIINNQMEKLFYWNDIHSRINRHANTYIIPKEDIFNVYTCLFIYQVFEKLYSLGERTILTKFEFLYFISFVRKHEELDDVVERILLYRNYEEKFELEKFLKFVTKSRPKEEKYQIFDTRYYEIFKYLTYFNYSNDALILKDECREIVFDKVQNFNYLLLNKNIIIQKNYNDYKKLLYSKKSLFEFFKLNNF